MTLRDRIAEAISRADGNPTCCDECPHFGPDSWDYVLADAVIAALQLTEDGGVIVGCIHD